MGKGFHLWLAFAVLLVGFFILHLDSNHEAKWDRIKECVSQEALSECDRHRN
jgi:hypothetical protein